MLLSLQLAANLDVDAYRADAEAFLERIEREYYLHRAGHKSELELERVYAAYEGLFSADRVAALRELASAASR